jgi:hypothetical protein
MIDQFNYSAEALPAWFTRPKPLDVWQTSLFAEQLNDVLAALRVSPDELARWSDRGWVSFGPEFSDRLEQPHVDEIRFVRDVTRSGLSDAMVQVLLTGLPRPMNFDPATIAYSFSLGWVQAVIPEEPDAPELIHQHLDDWLVSLANDDIAELRDLRERIDGLIAEVDPRVGSTNDEVTERVDE